MYIVYIFTYSLPNIYMYVWWNWDLRHWIFVHNKGEITEKTYFLCFKRLSVKLIPTDWPVKISTEISIYATCDQNYQKKFMKMLDDSIQQKMPENI